jgi:hypothetical protein
VTTLDAATLEGFAALLALDGRSFAAAGVTKKGIKEDLEDKNTRFDLSVEQADIAMLHFRKTDMTSWTVVEGLVLTSGNELCRVVKVMPDGGSPIQRLRCVVTTIT